MFHYFTIDKIDAISSINIHLLGGQTHTPYITLNDNNTAFGALTRDVKDNI